MPRTVTWWLYVLECHGGVLYTGIAKDVDARFAAHRSGTGASRSAALRAEYAFKQASRAAKLRWCAMGLESFVARARR